MPTEIINGPARSPLTFAALQALLPDAHVEPTCSGELVIYTGLALDPNDPADLLRAVVRGRSVGIKRWSPSQGLMRHAHPPAGFGRKRRSRSSARLLRIRTPRTTRPVVELEPCVGAFAFPDGTIYHRSDFGGEADG